MTYNCLRSPLVVSSRVLTCSLLFIFLCGRLVTSQHVAPSVLSVASPPICFPSTLSLGSSIFIAFGCWTSITFSLVSVVHHCSLFMCYICSWSPGGISVVELLLSPMSTFTFSDTTLLSWQCYYCLFLLVRFALHFIFVFFVYLSGWFYTSASSRALLFQHSVTHHGSLF